MMNCDSGRGSDPLSIGFGREAAAIDLWVKDLAPSIELRKWFGHEPARWIEFERRYAAEVGQDVDLLDKIRKLVRRGTVTLIYAARDQCTTRQ